MKHHTVRMALATFAALVVAVAAAPGQAAEVLYGVSWSNQLVTIDAATGAGTLVGGLTTPMASFGLASRNGQLFTFDQNADRIVRLDPLTGATLQTYNVGLPDLVGEGGLAFRDDGTGFLSVSHGGMGTLYSFSLDALSSSCIGTVDGLNPSIDGLDFMPGTDTLYGLSQTDHRLFTIDTATAATSLIGGTGIATTSDLANVAGLAFSSSGTLFAAMNGSLYSIDVTTAAPSLRGNIGFREISGLEFLGTANQVPEPGAMLLLGSGLAGLAAYRKRRVKR